jgi:hypothetical protein
VKKGSFRLKKQGHLLKTWINRAKLWTTDEKCAKVRSNF